MAKIDRPRSIYSQASPSPASRQSKYQRLTDESNATSGIYSSLKNGAERAISLVRSFFEKMTTSNAPEASTPVVRASYQAQLRNLIARHPPSEKTNAYWNAFIQGIWSNPEASDEEIVSALEAMVYMRAFKELRGQLMEANYSRNLCYKIAEEVVQLLRDYSRKDLSMTDQLKNVYQKLQERNAPQIDEMNLKQFRRALKKQRIEVLNAPEMNRLSSAADLGNWPKDEYRRLHLINYKPVEIRSLGRVLAKMPQDKRFSDLLNRLFN